MLRTTTVIAAALFVGCETVAPMALPERHPEASTESSALEPGDDTKPVVSFRIVNAPGGPTFNSDDPPSGKRCADTGSFSPTKILFTVSDLGGLRSARLSVHYGDIVDSTLQILPGSPATEAVLTTSPIPSETITLTFPDLPSGEVQKSVIGNFEVKLNPAGAFGFLLGGEATDRSGNTTTHGYFIIIATGGPIDCAP
jgi:hypothetical protein